MHLPSLTPEKKIYYVGIRERGGGCWGGGGRHRVGMAAVLGYRAARWIRSKYRWWMAPAGAAAAGYVI
jgi:hypothetical protein